MKDTTIDFRYFAVVIVFGVFLVFMSLMPIPLEGPEPWLEEWTAWLATYISIGVAARGLWIIVAATAKRIEG